MNTPVNFEIAKLLKEKGFESMSEPESYYCAKDLGEYYWQKMGGLIVGWEHLDETCSPNHGVPNDQLVLAPTIAEVIMWLYEKHGVWISVGVDSLFYKGKHHLLIYYKNRGYGLELSPIENSLHGPYESPTEAYSAGIQYTLKNLIS